MCTRTSPFSRASLIVSFQKLKTIPEFVGSVTDFLNLIFGFSVFLLTLRLQFKTLTQPPI